MAINAVSSTKLLTEDATNRALRTFCINIATDVAVALVLVLVNAFNDADTWGDFEWNILAYTLAKTAVVTAGSFVLRRVLDPSSFPTPLPPAPQAEPAEDMPPSAQTDLPY